ncbi:ovochymase-like, partial [Saccostrea cucullata]|uniref:ovochymase-like n=1 Tax=Saccostrea cuccullata TaxID=36930 RepID=UPI002ED1F655
CDQLLASDLLYGDFAIKGPGRFPWQVGIRINNNTHTAPLCGGTILNSFWILSAAHCFEYFLKSELLIRVGDLNSKVTDSYEGTFEIEEIYIQPEYIIYDDGSLHNDIALLKVKPKRGRGISMDSNAQPACLPSENTVYSENLECYISGWGLTEY